MLFDSKTGLFLKAWCRLPSLILNVEKDWGESGEAKITLWGRERGVNGHYSKGG